MRSSRCLALSVVAFSLAFVSGAAAAPQQTLPIRHQSAVVYHVKTAKTTTLIAEATVQTWNCQDKLILLGVLSHRQQMQSPWSLPRSANYRKWVLQKRIQRQAACLKRLSYVSDHLIPDVQDWLGAVQWVQRIYPGTYDWLYTISDREGCNSPAYCPWVWYGGKPWTGHHIGNDFLGADTVGGPLQFRYSTFAPYWRAAQADLVRRGYIIPAFKMPTAGGDPKYAAWLSPMGQALTGAFMKFYGKEGCHWCL